eukprot:TRINITY_DN10578_c0_g1_i3.p1 TRINITY_DN10578_c0_g1~~TRINITY_DN10578_c0_g1_i3.p1  ORF type:complete len:1288 (-),score=409.11 TRINITY_DN10578_c0_g1_i3:19-3882(-)
MKMTKAFLLAAIPKVPIPTYSRVGKEIRWTTRCLRRSPPSTNSNANPITTIQPPKPGPKIGITQYQLFQLKAQILAYKYLSRNMPLPPKLLSVIRTFSMKGNANGQGTIATMPGIAQQISVQNAKPATPQLNSALKQPGMSPLKSVSTPTISKFPVNANVGMQRSPAWQPQKTEVTSTPPPTTGVKPDSLSVEFMLQERERRIKSRMQHRMEELKSLPNQLPTEVKMKAVIEMKQLQLLDLQKRLRGHIVSQMRRSTEMEASYASTAAYKRATATTVPAPPPSAKKQGIQPTRIVPNYDVGECAHVPLKFNPARLGATPDMLTRHAEFITAVLDHHREFKAWHGAREKKMKKFQKDMSNHYANELKRQQAREEREKAARLVALQRGNIVEYRKLLESAKQSRLTQLLNQTDEYLEKIGAMLALKRDRDDIQDMKDQKEKQKERKGKGRKKKTDSKEEDKPEEPKPAEENPGNKKYYTLAHSIEEKITTQPDMVVGGKLKNYQLVGLQWLVSLYNNKLNGILADEMGLGKTIQTISLLAYLMEKKNNNGPFLVIAPLSTMSNWILEFQRWAPAIKLVIYKGKPAARKQIYREEMAGGTFNAVLTSYEYVMLDKSDLGKVEWDYIIIDEGHRIKNKNSKLSNILRKYMSRHRLLLTGTPLQNDLGELWSLLNFLLPTIFNSSDNFETWFNAPFAYAQQKKKSETTIAPNEEETLLIINRLHKVLRPFLLRRLKQDVESELPEKVETVIKCDMSTYQWKMYHTMKDERVVLMDPNAKGRTQKGFNNTLMQLQKICNHPYLFLDEYNIDDDLIRASGKFALLDRLLPKLKASDHRILIFNQMTQCMTIMEDFFQHKGYNPQSDYLRLDGGTKAEDRSDLVKKWNAKDSSYWLFILSTKAGGLGLNLQTADTVIIFDTDWNPQADLQAQDRAHRIGQQKEVRVFRLVSNKTVEEKILEKASFKLDVDAKVIQAGMFNTHSNDKMRKAMLESLLYDDNDDKEVEVCASDDQINALVARTDEEYQLFQKLDAERDQMEETEWRMAGNKGPRPSRLMSESELPEYLRKPIQKKEKELEGRGRRVKNDVIYNDGLSEDQFAEMVERGELPSGKRSRRVVHDSESEDNGSEDEPDSQEEEDNRDDMDSDLDLSSKRSREEEDDDDEEEEEPLPQKRQRGRKKAEGSEASRIADALYDSVCQAEDGSGRVYSQVFMTLPSRKEYADYYKMIKNPMSLKKIKRTKYTDLHSLIADYRTLFANALHYNQEGSLIAEDAKQLQAIAQRKLRELANDDEIDL